MQHFSKVQSYVQIYIAKNIQVKSNYKVIKPKLIFVKYWKKKTYFIKFRFYKTNFIHQIQKGR